ncbi:putative bifunctional diguanylate cyclase/phosphodiesterase [Neobacillus jeddahensis]|uniref:putative bifunctional diguanylate cyclase/phosphodiesterase n=1 Tax=Neobacillus jeddahensis TaxID=1461580 RepID=UPI000693DFE9|nr:GGDEF and EAL domain-containing protein [Neobacillus jeddahensis]
MIFLLMLSFSLFPLAAGVATIYILGRTNLSKFLFLFFIFTSFWQIDSSILHASEFLSVTEIDFFFRFFRFGSILLAPTLFTIIYVAINQTSDLLESRILKYVMTKQMIIILYSCSLFVYLIGWGEKGITSFEWVKSVGLAKISFFYPIYGEWSWLFILNLLLFIIIIVMSLVICLKLIDSEIKAFLQYFILITTIGYCIGVMNMFKDFILLPSSIAVLFLSVGIVIPVTRMHKKIIVKMNNALIDQKEFLHRIIDLNPSYIYAKSDDGRYTLTNQAYGMLFGVESEDLIGNYEIDYNPDVNKAKMNASEDHEVLATFQEKLILEDEIVDANGNRRWIQTIKLPIVSSGEKQVLCVATDITQRKTHEKRIEWQALHDTLTGLPNRRAFNQELVQRIQQAKKNHENVAVVFLDLDRFKIINDTLNHENGDLLLKKVAKRLNKVVVDMLTDYAVYRLGGDEFTFILSGATKEETTIFVQSIISVFKKSFTLENHELFVTSSMGISMYPADGDSPELLIKNADIAMYSSKESGKNAYTFFSHEMNENYRQKMVLEEALRKGLELDEFIIHYQPKIDIDTNTIVGMEALIRWASSDLGMVSPGTFIPLAEETGLILPIGEWVLKTSCLQNKRWQEQGFRPIPISVNISMRQFSEGNFVETVKRILDETELDPNYLELEITESISMSNIESVISKLQDLKKLGIAISIDDFGTGYSSLNYLKRFPIDTLKIDQSFVRDIRRNAGNRAIVKTIISMANNLDLDVIAEGVETEAELKFLKENSCKKVQGYFFSQPLTKEEFEQNYFI